MIEVERSVSWRARPGSDAFECFETVGSDRVAECGVVALVLVGVALCEVGDRLVEAGFGAEVAPVEASTLGAIVSTTAEPFMSRSCRQYR